MKKYLLALPLLLMMSCSSESVVDELKPETPAPTDTTTIKGSDEDKPAAGFPAVVPLAAKTPGEIILTSEQREMAHRCNDFAFQLLRSAANRAGDTDLAISPVSVGYLLGMLNSGADGLTRQEISNVMGLGNNDVQAVNAFYANMLLNAPGMDEEVRLATTNALYANTDVGAEFSDSFAQDMRGYYLAGIENLDFTDPSALKRINQWSKLSTEGMIPEILTPDELNPSAWAILLNSVYFNAPWSAPFDEENTRNAYFIPTGSMPVELPMMKREGDYSLYEDDSMSALSLPYGNGDFRMIVVLPVQGNSTDAILASLTAESWQELCGRLAPAAVSVMLPRFETKTSTDLIGILSEMGMPSAFIPDNADFHLMTADESRLYIGLMKQKACIEVTEAGTKAAATTVAEMEVTSSGEESEVHEFHANHPFLYFIVEQSTGVIFFSGKFSGT